MPPAAPIFHNFDHVQQATHTEGGGGNNFKKKNNVKQEERNAQMTCIQVQNWKKPVSYVF